MSPTPNDSQSGQSGRRPLRRRSTASEGPRNRRSHRRPITPAHHRRPTAIRALTRRHLLSPHPTTVWPFADVDQLPGTAQLAGWLGRVIVTLATRYTRPGDSVLLLNPPTPRHQPTIFDHGRTPDHYTGLAEGLWTVIRLGRNTETATASPALDQPPDPASPAGSLDRDRRARRGEPPAKNLEPGTLLNRHSETDGHPSGVVRGRAEQFDLVIAAVHSHDLGWLDRIDWNAILTPSGMLAAIMHSEQRNGRLHDPIRTVVRTLRNHGWSWRDHIAVLTQPLPEPTNTTINPSPRQPRAMNPTTAPGAEPPPVRLIHHDLLLFDSTPSCDTGETSDE